MIVDNLQNNVPVVKGRFAPSPSGRMHLGNIFTALMSWLSVKSRGGKWLLRIEDLDPQRSKIEFAQWIEDDLAWLGLDWDEGGLDDNGQNGPYSQSKRGDIYTAILNHLAEQGCLYPCRCTRADILSTQAPHQSDGRIVYQRTCRPNYPPPFDITGTMLHGKTIRIALPDCDDAIINFTDKICGPQCVDLNTHCGDFILRRADGAWAYQFAVVIDDALMGVTEVMRGDDLLLSTAQQIWLYRKLGFTPPEFAHLPLVTNDQGVRLSKRDQSVGIESMRAKFSPTMVIGSAAFKAGLLPEPYEITPTELIPIYQKRYPTE